jgi:ubiquinone/menaquinone biosynthesis C-methylase UbiE
VTEDPVLREQLEYYRARAGEYDQWWLREGRFDRGPDWFAESSALEQVLEHFEPRGNVLELACGTGLWTRHLVKHAASLTAVDASSEVLAINRTRVDDPRVQYIEADLFEWVPPPAFYDVIVFGFWLSHVPEDRFEAFWYAVHAALRPHGRVLLIDSARSDRSTAADHQLPAEDEQTMTRRLDDGREFQIVKRFFEPAALERDLGELGWEFQVGSTGEFFIYGTGTPKGRP